MLEDNLNKIIDDGINPDLKKLEKSSNIIRNNNRLHDQRVIKECMIAKLTIQRLKDNLSELERCYLTWKELKNLNGFDDPIQKLVLSTKRDVTREIDRLIKTNGEFEEMPKLPINEVPTPKTNQIQIVKDDLSSSKRAYQEVQQINQDLQDLHELMGKFGELVHVQQAQVDNIEQNVETAATNIHEGTKSLAKAASMSIAPIACAAAGAAVLGPIGALVSFKITTGVISALGGSCLGFSIASFVKKKNKEKIELDLENLNPNVNSRQ